MTDTHREFKDRLYGQFARLGKALANPHRLEMLELLAQGERTVDSLATDIGLSLSNATQHLQSLLQAALVESLNRILQPGDHVLMMSNGGFGGVHSKLLTRLART